MAAAILDRSGVQARSAVARQDLRPVLRLTPMKRRTFLQSGAVTAWAVPVIAAVQRRDKLDVAADVLARAAASGQVNSAVLHVRHRGSVFARSFGAARSPDELFL